MPYPEEVKKTITEGLNLDQLLGWSQLAWVFTKLYPGPLATSIYFCPLRCVFTLDSRKALLKV